MDVALLFAIDHSDVEIFIAHRGRSSRSCDNSGSGARLGPHGAPGRAYPSRSRSREHTPQYVRGHKRNGWRKQIQNIEKLSADHRIFRSDRVDTLQVPIHEAEAVRALSFDLWKAKVLARGDEPGDIDDLLARR